MPIQSNTRRVFSVVKSMVVLPLTLVAPTSSMSGESAATMSATASSVPVSTSRMTLVGMPGVCPIPACAGPSRGVPSHSCPTTSTRPTGFSIDIGEILREATKPRRRAARRPATNDMDAALRRAVRVELADVERALKELADEIVRLRRANEGLAEKVARLTR